MGSAFHQLCPRYSETLTLTAPKANRLWEIFTFFFLFIQSKEEESFSVSWTLNHESRASSTQLSRRAVVSYWRMYVHEVLVNCLGGLSLPRKSVVRLTDRPNMTLVVYRGRKTTKQQYNNIHSTDIANYFQEANLFFISPRTYLWILFPTSAVRSDTLYHC